MDVYDRYGGDPCRIVWKYNTPPPYFPTGHHKNWCIYPCCGRAPDHGNVPGFYRTDQYDGNLHYPSLSSGTNGCSHGARSLRCGYFTVGNMYCSMAGSTLIPAPALGEKQSGSSANGDVFFRKILVRS
jgi:hypothetical protein